VITIEKNKNEVLVPLTLDIKLEFLVITCIYIYILWLHNNVVFGGG
jgi:hypothetical protein